MKAETSKQSTKMEQRNILSILWENIRKSGIINEELLAENTFIQVMNFFEYFSLLR